MNHIRLLTFDLDDTLWNNRPVLLAAERSLYDWLALHYPRIGEMYTVESMHEQRMQLAWQEPDLALAGPVSHLAKSSDNIDLTI